MKQKIIVILSIFLLTACSGTNIAEIMQLNNKGDLVNYGEKRVNYYRKNPEAFTKDLQYIAKKFSLLEENVDKQWGKKELQLPERKKYVKYTNNYQDRAYIDFTKGIVRVETVAKKNSIQHLKEAIVTTLLAPDDPNEIDIFTSKSVPRSKETPFLYKQILDEENLPVRWKWRASKYADHLIKKSLEKKKSNNKTIYAVQFDLVEDSETIRSYKYADIVKRASKRYQIKESLIYAIIKTESSFNPYAISHANAYGLMQVIPRTAGRDVFQKIKKRKGDPTKEYLFNPENNIDTGTAYLYILKTMYLKDVKNSLARHYSAISAYNGGAGNVFKTFHYQRKTAVNIMNQKNSQQIYDSLTNKNPIAEARRYLYKVNKSEKQFINNEI